jgi:guanylate kinase
MSNKPARMIVLSGPTASGKSTLWRHLVRHPQVTFSVSATTRSIRDGEEDGRDYRFISEEEFLERKERGEFLEWAKVHGHFYGTLRSDIEEALAKGLNVLLEIDVQGAEQIQNSGLPFVSLFIKPPSLEILHDRLRNRGTESEEEMALRLKIVEEEMACAENYDHVVVNDDLEQTIAKVEQI